MAMNSYKKWLITALIISVVSIILVTCLTFNSETLNALNKIKPEYILLAVLSHILLYYIWGLRIQVLCEALGHTIGSLKSTEIVISSAFLAAITPAFAGGELLKMHLLNKNQMPLGKATAVVVGERLLDALIIFACLPFALYVLADTLSNYKLDLAFLIANILLFISLFIFIYAVWKPEKVKTIFHKILEKLAPLLSKKTDTTLASIMERVDREIDHFHESVKIFFSEGKIGLFWGVVYTILFWVVDFLLLVLILEGLSQPQSIPTVFAAQVILAVIMIIPATPGASGIAELGAVSIFSIFVSPSVLGIVVIAWRTMTYHLNLFLGGLMSLKVVKDMDMIEKITGDKGSSMDSIEVQKEPKSLI
jgi:uncharacterized protein (TIRG00374 family)